MRRLGLISLGMLLAAAVLAPSAGATVYNLTPANADSNNPVDGTCTFREATIAAGTDSGNGECNAGTGNDEFRLAGGNYDFNTQVMLFENTAGQDLLIQRAGAAPVALRHIGATPDRIFQIGPQGGDAIFNGVTISGGRMDFASSGGAISVLADSVLSLNNTTLTDNTVGTGVNNGTGGALALITATSVASLANVTVSGNSSSIDGGGIYLFNGSLGITGSTITDNHADVGNDGGLGGGIARAGGILSIGNSILAGNTDGVANAAPDCSGLNTGTTSLAGNVLGTNLGCGFAVAGNDLVAAPLLGPLADNTGPTFTHALLDGSPALNRGVLANCLPDDQRGILRPQGPTCDSGSFEREVTVVPPPPPPCSRTIRAASCAPPIKRCKKKKAKKGSALSAKKKRCKKKRKK